jgi:hypothetical protein
MLNSSILVDFFEKIDDQVMHSECRNLGLDPLYLPQDFFLLCNLLKNS